MQVQIGDATLELVQGDITKEQVDAIVNAANSSLLGGGGVDGAIHHAAGPQLLDECRALDGCDTGDAKITRGYRLPAKHVIHAVGPVYRDGKHNEPGLLAIAYRTSLDLASQNQCASVAFPAIATGIYGYPIELAVPVAISTVRAAIHEHPGIQEVIFCCFSPADLRCYEQALAAQTANR